MRLVNRAFATAIASSLMLASAIAADLTDSEIKALISGQSVYLETTAASVTGTPGHGVIYYSADGTALYKTPKGVMWHGTWLIKDNSACVDWKEQPNNGCVKYDKQGDTISIVNAATGQVRAKVVKIASGNAENLAP